MKFAIVLLALLAATYAVRPHSKNIQESSFRSGREYNYRFNGQLSAGIPIPSTPQGVSRIQTLARVQFSNDHTARVQLEDFQFATSQDEQNVRSMQPLENFDVVRMNKEHQQLLETPFEFTYRNGMISDILFAQNDQPWSQNIKRAVVNMLQVNVLKKDRVESEEKYERSEASEDVTSFTTVERTIEGECNVLYTLNEQTSRNQEEQQWTKSINFDKCVRRPYVHQTLNQVCQDCKQTLNDEQMSSTVMNFNITGNNAEGFLINSVELRSQHLFAPINEKHQLLSAFTINTLELIYAGEQQETKIEKIRGDNKSSSLIYNPEWELAEQQWSQTGEEKYLRQLPQWAEKKVEIVNKLFSLMAKQLEQEEIELETAHSVSRIVKVIRWCNEEELNKIWNHVVEYNEKENTKVWQHIRDVYFNALTLAGTRVTIQHFVEKVQDNKYITPLKASFALKSLVDMRYPSIAISEDVARLCESAVSTKYPQLRQSCWLSYGSIVNGICSQTPRIFVEQEGAKLCPRSTKQQIVSKLISQFESATTQYEQTLVLKTIANAGLDLSIYQLEKIINNQQLDTVIRSQAIESLRRLRSSMPQKVQQVLMPVYKNRQQAQHVRMSALYQIVQTQPQWTVLSQIGQQLRQEKNQQVRAFTLSLLRSFANSESPCEKTFSNNVESLLKTVPFNAKDINTFESRYGKWTQYWQRQQSGFDINAATIFTNESILPTEMMASIQGVVSGEMNQYFAQIGFTQHNVEKVLKQVMSAVQENGLEQVLVRGKRSSDAFKPTQFLSNLIQKMGFVRREQTPQQPHALFYIRHRDMDYAFLPIDADSIPETIKSMINGGRIEIGDIERFLAQGVHFSHSIAAFIYETTHRVPTPLGMPAEMTSKMPTVAFINGQLKFELEPKSSKKIDGLKMHLVARPQLASTHLLSLTVVSPIAQTGTKFLHQLTLNTPIDAKVEISWADKFVMKTFWNTPSDEQKLVMLQSRPVTFVRTTVPTARQYPEPVERTWMLPKSQVFVQNAEKKFNQYSVEWNFNTPMDSRIPRWIVDNTFELFYNGKQQQQYEAALELELFGNAKLESGMAKHFTKKGSKHQYYQQEEEYDEEEHHQEIKKSFEWLQNEKVYKHRLNFEIKPEIVNFDLEAVCNEDLHFCKTQFNSENGKGTIQYVYPMMPRNFEELKQQKYRNLVIVGEGSWNNKNIELKLQGQQSPEQKQFVKMIETAPEQEILLEASRLDQYQMVMEYDWEVSHNFWNMVQAYFSAQYPLSARFEEGHGKKNVVRGIFNIEPRQRQTINMTIETQEGRFNIQRVMLPIALPTAQIHYKPRVQRIQNKNILEKLSNQKNAECVVKSNKIQTFDKVSFKNQLTNCYTLLASDCGEQQRFFVLAKNVEGENRKNLKIVYRNQEIEMWMNEEDQMQLTLNGEEKEYEKETREISNGNNKHFSVQWVNERNVEFESDEISVHFDGYNARIQISPMYRNKQCGVCGHYDNEKETEFYSADNKHQQKLPEFVKSYIYQDGKCNFDEEVFNDETNFLQLNENEDQEEQDYQYTNEKKTNAPQQQLIVEERQHQICFSQQPVARCEQSENVVESNKQKTGFWCVPSSNSSARRLMRQLRRQPAAQWSAQQKQQIRENELMVEREWNVKVDERCF